MKIWKWLGLNNKEARIKMNETNNIHETIRTVLWVVGFCVVTYGCVQYT